MVLSARRAAFNGKIVSSICANFIGGPAGLMSKLATTSYLKNKTRQLLENITYTGDGFNK
jgi:hypothetical protein